MARSSIYLFHNKRWRIERGGWKGGG
jgi:hypothetical protein